MFHFSLLLLAPFHDCQETPQQAPKEPPPSVWQILSEKYDADRDGRITVTEHGRGEVAFENLDRNEDGVLTEADTKVAPKRNRGRRPAPEQPLGKVKKPPAVGEVAPDFELQVLVPEVVLDRKEKEGEKEENGKVGKVKEGIPEGGSTPKGPPKIKLSSFTGEKPVALIFGSYT